MPETLLLRLLLKSLHPSGCAGDPSFMSETLPDKIKTLPDYFESWWSTLRELMISDFFSFLVTIPVLRHILTSLRLFLMYLISLLYLVFQGCCQKKKKKVPQTGCLKTTESINNSLTVQEPRRLKSRYQQDWFLLEVLRGYLFYVFPSFFWLLALLGIPWLVDISLQSLPPPSEGIHLPMCLHKASYKDSNHWM